MVKIHLFSGFESARLPITRDTPLGHLYSDAELDELLAAAGLVGVNQGHLQCSRGFFHYDLWGRPLQKARLLFPHATNRQIYQDMLKWRTRHEPVDS
jgi:hypothetical protein